MDTIIDWCKEKLENASWPVWILFMPIFAAFMVALGVFEWVTGPRFIPILLWVLIFQSCHGNEKLEAIKDYTGDTSWATRRLLDK